MKKLLLAGIYWALAAYPLAAADLPAKTRAVPQDLPVVPCTVSMCSGFYFGGHLEGIGSNADILGSGINGSIFNSGAGFGAHAGYQVWNGNFFFAGEVGGTWYTGGTSILATVANVNPNWSVDYLGKIGYGLQGLFNAGPSTGSQGPTSIIQNLNAALISPYFIVGGRTRNFGSGLVTGGGAQYTLGGGWNAFAEYLHVNYEQTVTGGLVPVSIGTENVVRAGVNRMF